MNDMRLVIVPKSDQINADDLLAGPRTITVSSVEIRPGTEQPVSIRFEGDGGKPYKPCKIMCRVMVRCWGPDASKYAGRSMTLYRDPMVKWGALAVGGIRISHLSGIERDVVMALTETKGSKKAFTVKPLTADAATTAGPAPKSARLDCANPADWLVALEKDFLTAETAPAVEATCAAPDVQQALAKAPAHIKAKINAMAQAALERTAPPTTDAESATASVAPAADDDPTWPGPR